MTQLETYHVELRRLHHHRLTIIFSTIMAAMALFILSDYLLSPQRFGELLGFRLPAIGLAGLLMLANHLDRQLRYTWVLGFAGYLCTCLVLLLMMLHQGDITSPAYVGLIVIMIVYTNIAPLTAGQTLISGFALICLYLAAMVAAESFAAPRLTDLHANLFFLLCFVLIAAIQSWANSTAREEECRLRIEEQEAAAELVRQAERLEEAVRVRTGEQQASEGRYRLLYGAIADDVILVSPQGAILQASDSFVRRFLGGRPRPEVSLPDLVSEPDRTRLHATLLEVIARGEPVAGWQATLLTCDGSPFAAEINGALLLREDRPLGLQLVIRDIGIRRRLEERLTAGLNRVRQTESAAILALAKLSEYRDVRPGQHLERIRAYCRLLAEELAGQHTWRDIVTPVFLQHLDLGSILHDIGKVAIADAILFKGRPLTDLEREVLRTHTLSGGDVIKSMEAEAGGNGFLTIARNIAYFHHEHWDGSGYPYRLRADEIPPEARIVAVADAYEEMTACRAGNAPLVHDQAVRAIAEGAGSHFDPEVVEALLARQEQFDRLRASLAEAA